MQIYSSFQEQLFEFHFPIISQMMEWNNKEWSQCSKDEKVNLIYFFYFF